MPEIDWSEPSLAERLSRVQSEIGDAAALASRDPASITTIVVSKYHPASLVRELVDLGVTEFGENKHQEASLKAEELEGLAISWNFVGQLQSNKARAVASYATSIHSIDRASLLRPLVDSGVGVFIQLNLTSDLARGGVQATELMPLAESVLSTPGIRLLGLMAVAPLGDEPRAAFAQVRQASEQLVTLDSTATALSMGMSGDFSAAIAEGATHLRIGTAITGNRPPRG